MVSEVALSTSGTGVAEWSETSAYHGSWAIHLTAPGKATWNTTLGMGEGVNESRINIKLAEGTTLGDIESISWWVNTTSGYPPHIDLLLDLDGNEVFDGGKKDLVTGKSLTGNDDVLVAEFAYQPYFGPGYEYISPGIPYGHYAPEWQSSYYHPPHRTWVQTFQNTTAETGTAQVNNETVLWLYSGLPGPYPGGYFGTLADFKDGVVHMIGGIVDTTVNASTVVLEMQIELDNWLGPAEAYLDDVAVNGETFLSELTPPEIVVEKPESKTYVPGAIPVNISTHDLFGVNSVWYNVKNSTGDWVYASNRTYTSPTLMLGFVEGDYHFYAWAENTLGIMGENSETHFFVRSIGVTVDIKPNTLNLKSRGRWITAKITPPEGYKAEDIDISTVKLEFGEGSVEAEWGKVRDGVLMVKFSRSAVKAILSPGAKVEITATGKLTDGSSFEGSDTIRVIHPGNVKMNKHKTQNHEKYHSHETWPGNLENGGRGNGRNNGDNDGRGKRHGNQ